jgi:hypothetical protein
MKRDERIVRGYDLKRNLGDYKSDDNLQAWYRFDPDRYYDVGNKWVPNAALKTTNPAVGTHTENQFIILKQALSTLSLSAKINSDSFLHGVTEPRAGAVNFGGDATTNNGQHLQWQDIDAPTGAGHRYTALTTETWTVSLWFRFPEQSADQSPHLVTATTLWKMKETGDNSWTLEWDPNGGGSDEGAFILTAKDSVTPMGAATYAMTVDNSYLPGRKMRGWNNITVTASSQAGGDNARLPADWTVYFNGRPITGTTTTSNSRGTATTWSTLQIGDKSNTAPRSSVKIAIGEIAVWNTLLDSNAIKALYEAATTSASSGFVSFSPKVQLIDDGLTKDAYPTIGKSTDQDRLNKTTPHFDDQTATIDYGPAPGEQVNFPTLLTSGSDYLPRQVVTPNDVPNIYVGGKFATADIVVTATAPGAAWTNVWFALTDSIHRRVRFIGNIGSENPQKLSSLEYSFGLYLVDGFAGPLRQSTAAERIKDAIALAKTNGDLGIDAINSSSYVLLSSAQRGNAGNVLIEKKDPASSPTTLPWGHDPAADVGVISAAFTGGLGTPGIAKVASVVVGEYSANMQASFATDQSPFNDAREPVDIALQHSYLPAFAPGFTKTNGDRVMIEIDISPSQPKILRVVTGANGRVDSGSPALNTTSSVENTGLAYFNFKSRIWETVGCLLPRENKSGKYMRWQLPMEVTGACSWSSASFHPFTPGITHASRNAGSDWADLQHQWFWPASPNFLLDSSPRIFQPFTSLFAHRSTFNRIYDREYLTQRDAPAGTGQFYGLCLDDSQAVFDAPANYQPAIESSAEWLAEYPNTNLGTLSPPNSTFTNKIRWNQDVINTMTTDLTGLTKKIYLENRDGQRWDLRTPSIANTPTSVSGTIFTEALEHHLSAVGLPIAYTKFSTNPRFYASSSQLLNLSDYLDVPMLLESVAIETDVNVLRTQYTEVEVGNCSRASSFAAGDAQAEVGAWSTTNNFVDNLTFFLMRQTDTGIRGSGKAVTEKQAGDARRELITWSNNVFHSPYIGWDFWQSWSHPYAYAGDDFPASGSYGKGGYQGSGGAGPDGKWPMPATNGDPVPGSGGEPHAFPLTGSWQFQSSAHPLRCKFSSAYYPMCGRRANRVFEVKTETVRANVEACDSANKYTTSDVGDASPKEIIAHGEWGVFWSFRKASEAMTGVPDIEDRQRSYLTRSNGSNRTTLHFSSSVKISTHFPVRVCGPYAQHDTPVIAADTFCAAGDGSDTPGVTNISPFFMSDNPSTTGAKSWLSYPGNPLTTGDVEGLQPLHTKGRAGWDWLARAGLSPVAGNSGAISGPREYASCYGRYWPGGTYTSDQTRTPSGFTQPFSGSYDKSGFVVPTIMGRYGKPHVAQKMHYPSDIVSEARASSPRLYHVGPKSKLMGKTAAEGGRAAVGASWAIGISAATGRTAINFAGTTKIISPQSPFNRTLGQGLVGYAPNYVRFPVSGANVYNSAQLLLPTDQLILGVQWSPADPVHQSHRELKTILRKGDGFEGATTAWRGKQYSNIGEASYDVGPGVPAWTPAGVPPVPQMKQDGETVFTGWGNVNTANGWDHPGSGRMAGANSHSDQLTTYPKYGWTVLGGNPAVGDGSSSGFKAMEYQHRFLGWDSSNDLEAYMSSSCTIKQTPQIIRLYGVLLKDQKQFHHPLSQQLKSHNVHQALSNGSVLDQFQIEKANTFRRGGSARIYSGSMTAPEHSEGGPGIVTGDLSKQVYGYGVLNGTCQRTAIRSAFASSFGSPSGLKTTSYLYDMGSIKRHELLEDLSEVYYDSMAPDIAQLWNKDGFELLDRDEVGFKSSIPWAVWAYTHVGDAAYERDARMSNFYWKLGAIGKGLGASPNDRWPLAFPFEPRYHGVARRLKEQPLKVAGIIDRQPSAYVIGNLDSNFGTFNNQSNNQYKNATAARIGDADISGVCLYGGFRWANAPQAQPMRALAVGVEAYGSYTPGLNEFVKADTGLSTGLGTMWNGTVALSLAGSFQQYITGSTPRRQSGDYASAPADVDDTDWAAPPSSWYTSAANPTYDPAIGLYSVIAPKSAVSTYVGTAVENPRAGAGATIPNWRNSGYVFYPHYARVMNPRATNTDQSESWGASDTSGGRFLKSFTMRDATGPNWTPPLQFSYASGAFGEKCVKNHIFGVGSLMFSPEPIHVVMSSSRDTIATSRPQWQVWTYVDPKGTAYAPNPGDPLLQSKSYWPAYGNASHLDFFNGKPRGWRYGLINAFPTRPTCAFRRDQFGQFRDMLEQRQYTAYYVNDPPDIAIDRINTPGLSARVRQLPRELNYPVYCKFRTPIWNNPINSNPTVPPADTQCSNLSLYATSSLPYFDGEIKNRGALPEVTDVIIT